MKSYLIIVALVSLASSGAALAHAHLDKSHPMVNSSVAASPKTVDLEFNEDVQITALKLQAGDARDTDIGPLPKAPARRISVPLPTLTAGSYTLIWRALGDDNHVVTGKIPFKVGPDAHGGKAQ